MRGICGTQRKFEGEGGKTLGFKATGSFCEPTPEPGVTLGGGKNGAKRCPVLEESRNQGPEGEKQREALGIGRGQSPC